MIKIKKVHIGKSIIYLSIVTVLFLLSMFLISNQEQLSKDIIIIDKANVSEELEVTNLVLLPGESQTYPVSLKSIESNKYTVSIKFNEVIDGGLKEFLELEVILLNDIIERKPFKDLLDENYEIKFEITLKTNEVEGFSIRYIMPIDVGNEAMKTFANFKININISRLES